MQTKIIDLKKGENQMLQVLKRNGTVEPFDIDKIKAAVREALVASKTEFTDDVLDLLVLRITSKAQEFIDSELMYVDIEKIQDCAEETLSESGFFKAAKEYILYREKHARVREITQTSLDYKDLVNKYLRIEDWRVKENSTVTYSIGGLILHNSGSV